MTKLLTDGECRTLAGAIAANPARNGSDIFRQPRLVKMPTSLSGVVTPCFSSYTEYRIKCAVRDGKTYYFWQRVK